ncbi:PilC/PilY family type IV pilus protein [Variovorax dokdonensis]|uniref:PilC/PilY family type IV pilus protein n=1 Tax=Variovorax dokdonensis TaxID=344883 RepID=A0ABT7N9M0_9BURK|nr:PilC/PilY family type IV pilus protein [Variovorax dokdonensis]MDM0044629.1 PilC/PilY family type IV pilus protein [Variovorax dokdonensis]
MTNTRIRPQFRSASQSLFAIGVSALLVVFAGALMQPAYGQSTDLASEPLATRPTVQAKPNLMFILDNSGSMNWSYMPDDLGVSSGTSDQAYLNWYGYYSPQCNGVAFDPNGSYPPPLDASGASYANINVKSAPPDGYTPNSGTKKDLTQNFYFIYTGSETPMSWSYKSGDVDTDSDFYKECSTKVAPGNSSTYDPSASAASNGKFTRVDVSAQSAAVQQKYANWYSYYRKRYLLMRSAMGHAVKALDASYRVGFTTINDNGDTNTRVTDDGTNLTFRDVKDFDGTQKTKFYSSLYSAAPNGSTPLRAALSRVGTYYAKLGSGQTYDPMQYSCQRNYALLSTDGYWNSGSGYKLNGQAVGNQDGTLDRPMRDSSITTATTTTVYSSPSPITRHRNSNTQTRTRTWTRTVVTVSTTPKPNNPNKGKYAVTTVTQRYTQTQTQRFSTPQTTTATFTRTSVSIDGATPTVTDGPVTYGSWQNGTTDTILTDTGDADSASSYQTISTGTTYQNAVGTGVPTYSNPSPASWGGWSPSSPTYTNTSPDPGDLGLYVAGTPSTNTVGSGGSSNTLADVAQYYYNTDLRTSGNGNCTSDSSGGNQDVCDNIVRAAGSDSANWQHLNTFTVGLGVSGTLPYTRDYLAPSDTYRKLTTGELKWPTPSSGGQDAMTVDDLWHAAVNGRGRYYSAQNANALSDAINGVINDVQATNGSASAASTSALELVAGDNNYVYQASYTTQTWTGDLLAFKLTPEDGTIATNYSWSAQAKLSSKAPAQRNIYFRGSAGTLQPFVYPNLSSTQQGYFSNICSQVPVASQCASLTQDEVALANSGSELVNYLRGDRTRESASTGASKALYRQRSSVLGDIINGAPVHVGKPPFAYSDNGYASFASSNATRKPVVYVGANDGMLHAFSASGDDGGTELWAYVPGQVMANMYKLANSNYATGHQYFVDGAPVMGDVQVNGVWKTIVVGGFNSGGRGYYALDITDPENPVSLWEFTDTNMGLSFGNPVITKKKDGTWVVAFASGYNNGADSNGDGRGHLYVLNAYTGARLFDIATSEGSSTSPSGMAKINAWIDSPTDNTTKRFYGGDLKGNLWRFDIDNLVAPNRAAMKLANFAVNGTPQPISTKPETIEVDGKPGVVVATGRYLGVSDISDTTQQSIYAVKDTLTTTGWGDVRQDATNFVVQTFSDYKGDSTKVALTNKAVDWKTKGGWYVDLPHQSERVSTAMALQYSTLVVASAIPSGDACDSGGASWLYYLNVTNGGVVQNNPSGVLWRAKQLIVGMSWIKDTNGNVRLIIQNSNGDKDQVTPPTVPPTGGGSAHRTSWRELVN